MQKNFFSEKIGFEISGMKQVGPELSGRTILTVTIRPTAFRLQMIPWLDDETQVIIGAKCRVAGMSPNHLKPYTLSVSPSVCPFNVGRAVVRRYYSNLYDSLSPYLFVFLHNHGL